MNLLDHLLANAGDFDELLGCHIRQLLDGGDSRGFELLDRLRSHAFQFSKRGPRRCERCHLRFDLAALFLLALDIDVPSNKLAGQPDVLSLLADRQRKLRVFDDNFETLFFGFDDLYTRHLRRAECLLRESDRLLAVRDDVDFFTAQLADDRLDAHALHTHARADGIHVLVTAFDRNFGALAGFARNRSNLHGAVVNFRDFHFEQALHQGGVRPRNDHLRAFRSAFDCSDRHAQAVPHIIRFEPGLFAFRQTRLCPTQIHDDVGTFQALDDAVHQFAHARVKFVIDRVAFGFPNFLQDHLLRRLCRDSAQHVRRLGLHDLAAHFNLWALFSRFDQRNLAQRVRYFFDDSMNGIHVYVAGFGIELRTKLFLGAIELAGRHNHRVFNGGYDHVGFDMLFPADLLDCLVQQTRHFRVS